MRPARSDDGLCFRAHYAGMATITLDTITMKGEHLNERANYRDIYSLLDS